MPGTWICSRQPRCAAGTLIVVVNNDAQQLLKKGRIVMPDRIRLRIVDAIGLVDDAVLAVGEGPSMADSLELVRRKYPQTLLEFCNGGDRGDATLPEDEILAAKINNIRMVFGVGGEIKVDSSSRLIEEYGL